MSSRRSVVYIQYTPGRYPPLEHSSRLLADDGLRVLFLGVRARGPEGPEVAVNGMAELGRRMEAIYQAVA